MPEWKPAQRGRLHGDRRAGARRGPVRRARRLDRAAAARRGSSSWRGARARVPAAAAAGAAGGRAGRRRAHVRADGAPRRAADDGLDRGAAGAARPGGRLRDPVPGAHTRAAGARTGRGGGARAACRRSPTAALATAAGFLVLLLSPVPMVQGFGVLLVVGVGIALRLALTGGTAALVVLGGGAATGRCAGSAAARASCSSAARGPPGLAAPAGESARRLRRGAGAPGARARGRARASRRWAGSPTRRPRCAPTCRALVPQDLPAVRDLDTLQADDRRGGRGRRRRRGRDLADPTVVAWMRGFQERVLKDARYTPGERLRQGRAVPGALAARPVPGRGRGGDRAADRRAARRGAAVLLQAVITADRRTANLAFGIRLMPLDEQHEVIERMRAIDPPRA